MQQANLIQQNEIPTVWAPKRHVPYLRVGVLKGSVGSHVLDDISQDGIHLSLLMGEQMKAPSDTNGSR